ncbi:CASP-like protein [Gossypium arboreum]|nr:CASP-like protein [Gossypium arboreum]
MAALSTTGLYSIITALASILLGRKPSYTNTILLAFALMDVVFVGIVASATGSAGSVAYIGLRGNSHVRWDKICNVYDEFCRHIGTAIAFSLFAAILLVFLTMFSTFALYKKIR